ncbi:dienelactone hydrolase family protein [Acerihabitans sp. TG2]|uniref:alpha/beta hydrolase n=1 Tax=Acerihabitans sp. TG2 TaxID=3096008 RepID=UPI002B22912B|nr:dienelactone hydrolase family protein [Acerihabitans sp. TG2]MEA9391962.1 dienelactone hydrolase family protein [Acerihabitans sp. TG2]
MSKSLVIMLHGVGSCGDDLVPLGQLWRAELPDTVFAAPDAPFPFDPGTGHQWFSIAGVTESNRPARVADARAAFDATLLRLMAANGLADCPQRVVLVGFSQGSIMALDAVASGRWPLAAVVAFSGRLSSPLPLAPSSGVPVLLIHGAQDPVINSLETERAAATLRTLGVAAQDIILPGLGHSLSSEGVALAGHFIVQTLAEVG